MNIKSLQQAFELFMEEAFEEGAISSTKASWAGSDIDYRVELFEDGNYRVLWSLDIGSSYDTPGILLGIPTLNDEEWDDDSPEESFFDNAEDLMREKFSEYIAEITG